MKNVAHSTHSISSSKTVAKSLFEHIQNDAEEDFIELFEFYLSKEHNLYVKDAEDRNFLVAALVQNETIAKYIANYLIAKNILPLLFWQASNNTTALSLMVTDSKWNETIQTVLNYTSQEDLMSALTSPLENTTLLIKAIRAKNSMIITTIVEFHILESGI